MCIQMHTHVYLVVLAIALEIRNKAPWSWRSYERRWKREYTKIKWKRKIKQNTETHQVRKMHLVVYIHAWRVRPVARWCIVSAAPSRAKKKCIFFFCCVYGCTTPRQRTPMHTYTLYAQHIIISSTKRTKSTYNNNNNDNDNENERERAREVLSVCCCVASRFGVHLFVYPWLSYISHKAMHRTAVNKLLFFASTYARILPA